MPGRLIDLGARSVQLPRSLIVDTNLVVARFVVANKPPHLVTSARASHFFHLMRDQRTRGVLTPVIVQEVFHVAIREHFQRALPNHLAVLQDMLPSRRRFDWLDLYKVRPTLLDGFSTELELLRRLLDVNRLVFLQPSELPLVLSGPQIEQELLRLVGRYHLDTNDAAILLDAKRAGISSIATLDADLRRAQLDFDVYTWLS